MTHYVSETFVKKAGKEGLRAGSIAAIVVAVLAAYAEYNGEDVPDQPKTEVTSVEPVPHKGNMGEPDCPPCPEPTIVEVVKEVPVVKEVLVQDQKLLNAVQLQGQQILRLEEQLKQAQKSKPYTGIKVYVPNPKGVIDRTDLSCPPCTHFIQGILSTGNNWTVGTTNEYTFWLASLDKEKGANGYPVFEVVVNDIVQSSWVGYDWQKGKSELYKVLNRHPNVKEK